LVQLAGATDEDEAEGVDERQVARIMRFLDVMLDVALTWAARFDLA